jgi:hypothetical protein
LKFCGGKWSIRIVALKPFVARHFPFLDEKQLKGPCKPRDDRFETILGMTVTVPRGLAIQRREFVNVTFPLFNKVHFQCPISLITNIVNDGKFKDFAGMNRVGCHGDLNGHDAACGFATIVELDFFLD